MKHTATRLLLILSAFALVSCQSRGNQGSKNPIDATFYYNCPGHEGEVYQNVSSDPTNPSYPMVPGYLFQGWYTEKENGDLWDFTSSEKVPSSLYAHWLDWSSVKTDHERLRLFVNTLIALSGTVNSVYGENDFTYSSALASGQVFGGTNAFLANRYENNFVETYTYSPYYAASDVEVKEEDSGQNASQVNAKNFFCVDQESYEDDGRIYNIRQYNIEHEGYDKTGMKDGYTKSSVMNEEQASKQLDISFAAYFLGYPSVLLALMDQGHKFYRDDGNGSSNIQGDFYYFKNVDPTTIDVWGKTGAEFEIAFSYTRQGSSGMNYTIYYDAGAGVAFKDGKIAHCTVNKIESNIVDGDPVDVTKTQSFYDFHQGDYEHRPFEGTRFQYQDFTEITEDDNSASN